MLARCAIDPITRAEAFGGARREMLALGRAWHTLLPLPMVLWSHPYRTVAEAKPVSQAPFLEPCHSTANVLARR